MRFRDGNAIQRYANEPFITPFITLNDTISLLIYVILEFIAPIANGTALIIWLKMHNVVLCGSHCAIAPSCTLTIALGYFCSIDRHSVVGMGCHSPGSNINESNYLEVALYRPP